MNAIATRLCAAALLLAAPVPVMAQASKERATLTGLKNNIDVLAISADGKLLAAGGAYGGYGELKLWDLTTGKERPGFKGSDQWTSGMAFAPDGKTLAVCGPQRQEEEVKHLVKFYDVEGKKGVANLQLSGSVHSLAYSPDGKLLAMGCGDKQVRVWDFEAKKPKVTLKGPHTELIGAVAYSPDGKTIASGGYDKLIVLWDVDKGKERAVLKDHTDQVRGLAYSPDGKLLASAGWDKTVRLWDAASGAAKGTLMHKDSVTGLAFAPDGKTLAAAVPGFADMVVLWDVAGGKEKASLKLKASPYRVAFTPDGKTLAVGCSGGAVLLFDVSAK